ncbi:MAG: hypothetical protein ACMXX5_01650 [Candidatus Woesearchaeota archaeon]
MISVIGAGPAGSYYASKEKHDDILLFEEDASVGKPVSCTGIVTDSINKIMKVPNDSIVSKIKAYKIISPGNKQAFIKMKNPDLLLDRTIFDNHLCEKALDNGAKLHLNERFLRYKKISKSDYEIKTSKSSYNVNMIVGADGPKSNVAVSARIYGERQFARGLQARCRHSNLEEGVATIYLNKGEFSWIVPENSRTARVGVVGTNLEALKKAYSELIGKRKIIETQSGLIPLYNNRQLLKKPNENVFLMGDAATHVKATTYGGIIYGLIAAQNLAQDKEGYEKNTKKMISKELWLSMKIRSILNRMTDKQVDDLLWIIGKKRNIELLGKFDRNYPSAFLAKMAFSNPRLCWLGMKLIFN